MIVTADRSGRLGAPGEPPIRCALGRGGVVAANRKREGDGCSPKGLWPFRRVLFRPDRVPPPTSRLEVAPIQPNDGWCDDPADGAYNRPVKLPYRARAERMWRLDGLYDVVVVLGHNDGRVTPGAGSAIFLHCAAPNYAPTEGCVAIARDALVRLVARLTFGDALAIT
jgi:L,D-peptidoglycan transpeptidase YkuD (ErfK/YbiS/YcfS/YnhG family)